jgi:hypothetical protein
MVSTADRQTAGTPASIFLVDWARKFRIGPSPTPLQGLCPDTVPALGYREVEVDFAEAGAGCAGERPTSPDSFDYADSAYGLTAVRRRLRPPQTNDVGVLWY